MGQLTVSYIASDIQKPEISQKFRMSSQHRTSEGHTLEEANWPLNQINYIRAVNSTVAIILRLMSFRQNPDDRTPELGVSYNEDADSFDMIFQLSSERGAFYTQYYALMDFFTEVEFSEDEDTTHLKSLGPIFLPENSGEQIEITFKISNLAKFVRRLQQYTERNNVPTLETFGADSARIPNDKTFSMVLNHILKGPQSRRQDLQKQALYNMPFAIYISPEHAYLTGLGTSNALNKAGIIESFSRIQGLLAKPHDEQSQYPALQPQ